MKIANWKLQIAKQLARLTPRQLYAMAGALLILFSVLTGLPLVRWLTAQKYVLSGEVLSVIGSASPALADKLVFDPETRVYQLNPEAKQPALTGDSPEEVAAQLRTQKHVTGGADTNAGVYSLDLPEDPREGVTIYDNNLNLSFSLIPEFDLLPGRKTQDRLVYPLTDNTKAIYTVKSNGLKEDIVFNRAPKDGTASFTYQLKLPDSLEARLLDDGSLGIYSADPALFGNMTFGSDADQAKVQSARQTAPKNHLVFSLPRPVIATGNGQGTVDSRQLTVDSQEQGTDNNEQTADSRQQQGARARAWFSLKDNVLGLHAEHLDSIAGAFSIDPSVVVTSASDFASGNNEGGIDFTDDEIRRGGLTGGSVGNWSNTTSLSSQRAYHATVVYNGHLYVLGGHNGSSDLNTVQYASLNSDGSIGVWQTTSSFSLWRSEHSAIAYNGYIYLLGGRASGARSDVEYAQIKPDGSLGEWVATTSLTSERYGLSVFTNKGYLYVAGGYNGVEYLATVEYAPIKSDGSIGEWQAAASFTNARYGLTAVSYDGYAYILGGVGPISPGNHLLTNRNDVQYARINNDGSLGAWDTTTSFATGRRYHTSVVKGGYIYVLGGGSNDVQYAPINSNGSVGEWRATDNFATNRAGHTSIAWGEYIYVIGGRESGNTLDDVQYAKIDPPGATTEYSATTSLPAARGGHSSVVYNGYIYVMGGCCSDPLGFPFSEVYYAPINSNGTLGAWNTTTSLPALRGGHVSVVYRNFVYVIGGSGLAGDLSTVEYAQINSDGTLGTWEATTGLGSARIYHDAVVYGEYLYVLGGHNTPNTVEYAHINSDGTLGSWAATTSLGSGRSGHAAVAHAGYIYVIGGTGLATVEFAPINSDGTLGSWTATTSLSAARRDHKAVAHNGHIYVSGGFGVSALNDVQHVPVSADGSLGTWQTTASFNTARTNHTSVVSEGNIYIIGGSSGGDTVQFARINNGGQGTVGTWSANGNLFNSARRYHDTVVYNGYLYVTGGYTSGPQSTVRYAEINSNGTIGTWSSGPSFATGRYGHASVAYNGYLYVIGGFSSSQLDDVQYAPINSDGSIGSWSSTTSFSPLAGHGIASFAYNNYLYITGGCTVMTCSYTIGTTVYAPINPDGTVGAWTSNDTYYDSSKGYYSSVVHNGYLYVIGGRTTGSSMFSTVEYAPINSNGSIGTWSKTTSLPTARYGHTSVVQNGYLYVIGGWDGTNYYSDVLYAPINSNGSIGTWSKTTSLPTARYGHTSVVYNGYLYTLGGQSSSSTLSEVLYTTLHSIPRTATYSKLIDMGSEVAVSGFDYNGTLSDDSSISLKTAGSDGEFGDSVDTSALGDTCETALSARYVLVTINLDDNNTAVFPDTNQSSIQDFTIESLLTGTPTPLRLRGGKYFGSGVLSPMDTAKDEACPYGLAEVELDGFMSGGLGDTYAYIEAVLTSSGDSPILKKGIAYSTQPGVTLNDTVINDPYPIDANNKFSVDLTSLTPSTTYYYRFFVTNYAGTAFSDEYSFTTKNEGGGGPG